MGKKLLIGTIIIVIGGAMIWFPIRMATQNSISGDLLNMLTALGSIFVVIGVFIIKNSILRWVWK